MVKKTNGKAKTVRAIASKATDKAPQPIELARAPDERLIRERAYDIWIAEGQPHGRDVAHWRRAHQELLGEAQI